MTHRCFCCNLPRHCTYKITAPAHLPGGDGGAERKGDGKDAAAGGAWRGPRYIGAYCNARISRVAEFERLMREAADIYRGMQGDVTSKELQPLLDRVLGLYYDQTRDSDHEHRDEANRDHYQANGSGTDDNDEEDEEPADRRRSKRLRKGPAVQKDDD